MPRVTDAHAISSAFGFRPTPKLRPGWSASLSQRSLAPISAARPLESFLATSQASPSSACLRPLAALRRSTDARLASTFGKRGNVAPATLSFLAGVGWFTINTIFGAYALQTIAHIGYGFALGIMLVLQIALAVYGYNLIGAFERACAVLLAAASCCSAS